MIMNIPLALTVQVRERFPISTNVTTGEISAFPQEVLPVQVCAPDDCTHTKTMCHECAGQWVTDYEVAGILFAASNGLVRSTFHIGSGVIKDLTELLTALDVKGDD